MDPYAKAWDGRLKWSDALMGYKIGSSKADLSYDTRDSAFAMPKSVVVDERALPPLPPGPGRAMAESLLYEAHVKGLTQRHAAIPPAMRGRYAGLSHPAVLEHLVKLGVTAVELQPVQAFFDDRFLGAKGLTNYWG